MSLPVAVPVTDSSVIQTEVGLGPQRLAELVEVRGRFHRSVHVGRDWARGFDSEYFVTPAIVAIADQVVEELARPLGTRAWTVTGPYGTGKSAFCLFLARLLASPEPDEDAARALRRRHLKDRLPLRPLLIQAERGPLAPAIAAAVGEARGLRLKSRARKAAARPSECVEVLVEAAARSDGGLVVIVDELGKYLEYAASRREEDVFLLQQIAEAAARSEKPLLFVSVLHSGFGEYVSAGDPARRTEWQKVQGRFRDVTFSLPADQLLELVGHALERAFPAAAKDAYEARLGELLKVPELRQAVAERGLSERLSGCIPLHPITALLMWPLFRSKVAQNERSLFAFLSSHEPHAFQEFLRSEEVSAGSLPLYRLPELYDYVVGSLGMATFAGQGARLWGLIEHALERVPASASLAVPRLVKSLGLLSLYGSAAGLRPDRELLRASLDDIDVGEVDAALDLLERESIVLYRRHRHCYGLWEGSDLDLEELLERGLAQRSGEALDARLGRVATPRPLVARGHYIRTGTLRFFEPRIAAGSTRACQEALDQPTQADGVLLFLAGEEPTAQQFADEGSDNELLASRASEISRLVSYARPVLVAVPKRALELGQALDELEAWRWVRENVGELAGDAVARQEVAAREAVARDRFEQAAGRTLGLPRHAIDPSACYWYYKGEELVLNRPRELQEKLSEICEETYAKAPPLHNELLNRHNLSSAAAKARRQLIEHAFSDDRLERLGIQGFPPEYSMYSALLEAGGFHRRYRRGEWRICAPNSKAWKPLWRTIETFVRGSRDSQRPLSELISKLEEPPYGLRRGPIPVLIALLLRLRGARLALYEDGLFVPNVEIETLERLLRRPETFSIRSYELRGNERLVIQELAEHGKKGVPAGPNSEALVDMLPIVRRLVRVGAQLPPYTRRTRRLSEDALGVRERLLQARDPRQLLLAELPAVLGVPLGAKGGPREFARKLGLAVQELTQALPGLLDFVEASVAETLGFEERGAALRRALRTAARPLLPHARMGKLNLFLSAASRTGWRSIAEWRSALALAIAEGQPPEHWNDELAESVPVRLRALRLELDELADIAKVAGSDPTVAVASIRVRSPGGDEVRVAFPCPPGEVASVEMLLHQWQDAARAGNHDARVQLQALALLVQELDVEGDEAGRVDLESSEP